MVLVLLLVVSTVMLFGRAISLPSEPRLDASLDLVLGIAGRTILVLVLVGLAATPAWLPVALSRVAPDPGRRMFAALQTVIDHHGRTAIVVLLGTGGLFFVGRGTIRLPG